MTMLYLNPCNNEVCYKLRDCTEFACWVISYAFLSSAVVFSSKFTLSKKRIQV